MLLTLMQFVRTPVVLPHFPNCSSFCVCGVLLLLSIVQVSSLIFSMASFDHSSHLKRLVPTVILFTKVLVASHKLLGYIFYCTVQVIMETLHISGCRRPMAEMHPLEIHSLFDEKPLIFQPTSFSANLIYLMVTISRFCFSLKTPCGQWQSFSAVEI